MKGHLQNTGLPSFHKIKGILIPEKEVRHNLEEKTCIYADQILFYESLTTPSFASTFNPKLVKTFS